MSKKRIAEIEQFVNNGNRVTTALVEEYSVLTYLNYKQAYDSLKAILLRQQLANAKSIDDLKLIISEMIG